MNQRFKTGQMVKVKHIFRDVWRPFNNETAIISKITNSEYKIVFCNSKVQAFYLKEIERLGTCLESHISRHLIKLNGIELAYRKSLIQSLNA